MRSLFVFVTVFLYFVPQCNVILSPTLGPFRTLGLGLDLTLDLDLLPLSSSPAALALTSASAIIHLDACLKYLNQPPPLSFSSRPSLLKRLVLTLLLSGDISLNPGPRPFCSLGSANLRSIKNKSPAVSDMIVSNNFDIFCMSETWLSPNSTPSELASFTPPNYVLFHKPRPRQSGGGVGIFVKQTLRCAVVDTPDHSSFEVIAVSVNLLNSHINVISIYRTGPPSSFFQEFPTFLETISAWASPSVITGDFNFHLDDTTSYHTIKFNSLLQSFNLKQHVNFPTHALEHTLDLLITPHDHPTVKSVSSAGFISDHCCISAKFDVAMPKPAPSPEPISYRRYTDIDMPSLRHKLSSSLSAFDETLQPDSLYDRYHSTLSGLLDAHAPLRTFLPRHLPCCWITPAILQAKRAKRQLERIWRRNKSFLNRSRLCKQVNLYNRLISSAKSSYLKHSLDSASDNPKQLWSCINSVLHKSPSSLLPDSTSSQELANSFSDFFTEKIQKIHNTFSDVDHPASDIPSHTPPKLDSFVPISPDLLAKTIKLSPTKSSCLDPWPTFLVKDCIDLLCAPITSIVNSSLSHGSFPAVFKKAVVTPLLKKPKLDRNELINYRPVSNLNFISKVLERIVATQLNNHIRTHNLGCPFQSAYQPFHSTETALLKIKNDIMSNFAQGKATALVLLDLSAAFDTIDHSLLLNRLSHCFGIHGTALKWFKSYLSGRHQSVKVSTSLSIDKPLLYGVPQGSVLGPLLFTLYTQPLTHLISRFHSLRHHFYADDTQLYIPITRDNAEAPFAELTQCLSEIHSWMDLNKLKLNPDKTEFIFFGTSKLLSHLSPHLPSTILGSKITCSPSVRNLGVLFDTELTFHDHISNVTRSSFTHIRDLCRLRRFLSLSTATSLANALVSSRLDYCNSLFYNINQSELQRLQRLQNTVCRIVTRTSRFASVHHKLKSLHWLPIRSRILFKTCLIIYKSLSYGKPSYLSDYLHPFTSSRDTRRSDPSKRLLDVPAFLPRTYTSSRSLERTFFYSAPRLWNNLPLDVRQAPSICSFRKRLKTHLFHAAFPT